MIHDKEQLRRHFKRMRSTQHKRFKAVQAAVEEELINRRWNNDQHRCLAIYWPLPNEIDLRFLNTTATVALPVADGTGHMVFRRWGGTELKPDGCGIPSPATGTDLVAADISLILVPALAVDRSGIRLGYGGGYYDRLRAKPSWRSVPSLVVLPEIGLSTTPLPRDPWDIPFDGWITEQGTGLTRLESAS